MDSSLLKQQFLSYTAKADEYYSKAYDSVVVGKRKTYWNWSAAFFGVFWLLYRRMYFEAFLCNVLAFPFIVINYFFGFSDIREGILVIVFFVLFGFFGSVYYVHCIGKRLQKVKAIPDYPTDKLIFHLAFWPILIASIIMAMRDEISLQNVEFFHLIDLGIFIYFAIISWYKYKKARQHNIV